ncbi:efflux RND transporter permease subunit [Mangrovibacillus cuniculi]|uniref:Efflux RND transporter permease subunit n=1 Tax=Mangrovibacillus cuniculi TaxID=2593652 RepID=A0A7S8CA77_9BACI|nr:efflux RND transporter permease subunit [Mangrovibacillus cuniculi]QPC46121.1 efflux RND transporter permease subunit [Mangrovibacillus cuniculi]
MNISTFSVKRPVFTFVTMLLVIILGGVSLTNIPLKLIPDINPPVGVIVTNYPGASPEEVSEKVTKPLEESLSTLPGIQNIRSTSQEGSNFILMEFSWTTSIDDVQDEITQRINQTPIPDGSNLPRFLKFDPSQFPVIQLSLSTSSEDKSINQIAETLELELTRVPGVASVNLSGTVEEEIVIELDQEALEDNGLGQQDITNVLQASNISQPGDTVLTEDKQLTTRVVSLLTSVEDVRKLVVGQSPQTGEDVLIDDVAQVNKKERDISSITRANEKDSVLISVLQQSDANTANVSREFQTKLNELLDREEYQDVQADILFDQGDYITQSISNIATSLVLGGIFAMLVLFFFLRNVRSPLIIGVAIPYSVIVTFVLMYFSDFALNIMTLGALALGIGMLVDNAIVVIENIYRHLQMGKDSKTAAIDGAKEIGTAITASTLTTVAVFVPVLFVSGLIGELFTEFALTISFSLLASLVVALTVIPMLAAKFLKKVPGNQEARRRRSKALRFLENSIRWTLHHRMMVTILTLALLGGSIFALSKVGTEFLPATDEGFFTVRVDLEAGTNLQETDRVVKSIEKVLENQEEIDVYVSLIGSTQENSARGSVSTNIAEISVKLAPLAEREKSVFEVVDELQSKIKREAKKENESAEVSVNLQTAAGSSPQTLTFDVRDTSKERLDSSIEKLEKELADVDGVTEFSTDRSNTIDEISIEINTEKAREVGLLPAQLAQVVNDATRGALTTQIQETNGEVYNVYVQYDRDVTSTMEGLENLSIKTPTNSFIKLNELATIEVAEGPVELRRINREEAVQFELRYSPSLSLSEISSRVDAAIEKAALPSESTIAFGGDRELLENSINDMILAVVLAIILVYIVMAAQFESFKYPFVIMFTVPLMIIGVSLGLYVTSTPISITAIIGVIVLAGIVVNNAIVIVDYINQLKDRGESSLDAIVTAVKDRARPIFMTALTTILGLLPLSLGIGEGTELNQPMAITVIGGLISSTLLTLYIIPMVYSWFDPQTRRMKN